VIKKQIRTDNDELHHTASETKNNPLAFIKHESLFGNLAKSNNFIRIYTSMLEELYKNNKIDKMMQGMI